MTALNLFKKAVSALKNYVMENTSFSVDIDVSSYPVKISFYEESRQLSINSEEAAGINEIAGLQFVFYDKMQIKAQEDFHVAEKTFNKLKNLSKEVNRLYLNAFFAKFDSFRKEIAESLNDCGGFDIIGNTSKNWQGKEYFLAIVRPQDIIDSLVKKIEIEAEVE